jgi:hypothetical protein
MDTWTKRSESKTDNDDDWDYFSKYLYEYLTVDYFAES